MAGVTRPTHAKERCPGAAVTRARRRDIPLLPTGEAMLKKPSTDAVLVLFHWSAAVALVLSLLTGLRIAADDAGATVSRWVAAVSLQGSVHWLHNIAGLALAAAALGYFVY